ATSLRDAVLAEHGRGSVLVNNAGVALLGRFEELEIAEMEWLFAVNFWGTVRMGKAFVPALRRGPRAPDVPLTRPFARGAAAGPPGVCARQVGAPGSARRARPRARKARHGCSARTPRLREDRDRQDRPRRRRYGSERGSRTHRQFRAHDRIDRRTGGTAHRRRHRAAPKAHSDRARRGAARLDGKNPAGVLLAADEAPCRPPGPCIFPSPTE